MNNATPYTVISSNFNFHAPIACTCFGDALVAAKNRGFEAHINFNDGMQSALVATWSPLYGTKVYHRDLTHQPQS